MKRRRAPMSLRLRRWSPLLLGGTLLQFNLTGCDPEVREAVLGGVQSAMTGMLSSIINAFFLSLQGTSGATSQPIVKAVFENLQNFLA